MPNEASMFGNCQLGDDELVCLSSLAVEGSEPFLYSATTARRRAD
ncbi:MAG: hypothetical protein AAGA48_32675 [Myxococcota bacterium]